MDPSEFPGAQISGHFSLSGVAVAPGLTGLSYPKSRRVVAEHLRCLAAAPEVRAQPLLETVAVPGHLSLLPSEDCKNQRERILQVAFSSISGGLLQLGVCSKERQIHQSELLL